MVHRRPVIEHAVRFASSAKCTQENALKLLQTIREKFSRPQTRWDVAEPCGGVDMLEELVREGWDELVAHGRALLRVPPSSWSIAFIEGTLSKRIAVLGTGAKYHRGHHVRSLHLLGCHVVETNLGALQVATPWRTWSQADWEIIARLMPGTGRAADQRRRTAYG